MIHFRIGSATLCGAEYTEPSKKAAKDGRLCDDCIQVMWKEQYRRKTLMPYLKKAREAKKGTKVIDGNPQAIAAVEPVAPKRNGFYLIDQPAFLKARSGGKKNE